MDQPPANRKDRPRLASAGFLFDTLLHGLKQPLNLIRVVAQDIRLDVKRERLQVEFLAESMKSIEEAVDALARQLDQLRSFARPPQPAALAPGTAPLTDLGVVCRDTCARVRQLYPQAVVTHTLPDKLPAIAIDHADLVQALWELLDNGVQAAHAVEREPRIALEVSWAGADVLVAIHDNGGGVPEPSWATLFEPFHTTRPGASGMGLPLARSLLAQAGGTLELAASTDTGSCFELHLPLSHR